MEEKLLLLGKHVIINKGDFKGVSGILKSIEITDEAVCVSGSNNQQMIDYCRESHTECKIIVNENNIIKVSLECVSSLV